MRFLGLALGGTLGIIQGYTLTPFYMLSIRITRALGYRLFVSRLREINPVSWVALIFAVIGIWVATALVFLPMALIGNLYTEFRRTAFLPSWSFLFIFGMVVYRLKEERQKRYFR